MKYIDTRTQDYLKQGVMKFLNLTEDEMEQIFKSIYYDTEKEPWEWVRDFISEYIVGETLEYIQMFHLSRRLNDTDLCENNNLEQLLLEDTSISRFFKKHSVTFKKGEGHIDMFFKGKLQPLDNEFHYRRGNIYYIRSRLGYNTAQDYCVNGFAFRSYLEENYYFTALSAGPELVQNIESLLNINGMVSDYYKNSKYYCIEYLVPLSEVIFDMNNPPKTDRGKVSEFLCKSILRLYDGWINSSFLCDENLILRLSDNAEIKPEWFVDAEEILI